MILNDYLLPRQVTVARHLLRDSALPFRSANERTRLRAGDSHDPALSQVQLQFGQA